MADVKFRVTRVLAPNANGNFDVEISDFGGTPKAAMFFATYNNSSSSGILRSSNAYYSQGFTDGTNEICLSNRDQNGVGNGRNFRGWYNDRVVSMIGSSSAETNDMSFVSFGLNKVTLNRSDTNRAIRLTVVLIGGDDISNVKSWYDNCDYSSATNQINNVGFRPDLVFVFCDANSSNPVARASHAKPNLGIAIRGADQGGYAAHHNYNSGSGNITHYLDDANAVILATSSGASHQSRVQGYDSAGFEINGDGMNNYEVYYFAIKFSTIPQMKVFTEEAPISTTGDNPTTGIGFKPSFGMYLAGNTRYIDAYDNGADSMGTIVFDDQETATNMFVSEDGAGTWDTDNVIADKFCIPKHSTGNHKVANFVSFDSDGWTFNYTTSDSAVCKMLGFAIEGPEEAGGAAGANDEFYLQNLLAGGRL